MTHSNFRPSLPPSDALIAFRLARDLGSYAAAARAEGVNHATILRRVAALEAWLGSKVFERAGRGVVLTPAGQRFAAVADTVVAALEDAADRWRPDHAPARIMLSVLPSFARLRLMPVLANLLKQPSGKARWRVEVSISHRPVALGDGGHDLAVRYGTGRWDDVMARPLEVEPLIPVAHADLLGGRLNPRDLAQMPLIHDSDKTDWRRWFEARGRPYRLKPTDLRFEDYDIALEAAKHGLGALLLRHQGGPISGPLVAIGKTQLFNPRRHWVVTAKDEERPAVLNFAETLHAVLRTTDG